MTAAKPDLPLRSETLIGYTLPPLKATYEEQAGEKWNPQPPNRKQRRAASSRARRHNKEKVCSHSTLIST